MQVLGAVLAGSKDAAKQEAAAQLAHQLQVGSSPLLPPSSLRIIALRIIACYILH